MTVGAVLGAYFIVYEINCIMMCMRPEMAIIRVHKMEPMFGDFP